MIQPGTTYLITRRTIRRHHLFRPDDDITRIFNYCLAEAAEKFGVLVHSFCLMSTHVHLVLTDPHGQLSPFLERMHRHMALGTKVLRRWEGSVWDTQATSVVRLLSPEAVVEKMAYVHVNPVAAGLVRRSRQWPGASTRPAELGRWHVDVNRPKTYFRSEACDARTSLRLTMPPMLEALYSDEEIREMVEEEVRRQERAARAEVRAKGWRWVGAKQVMQGSPYDRATSYEPLRDRNPTFAVGRGQAELMKQAKQALRAFRHAYRDALKRWRETCAQVCFPEGTYLMQRDPRVRVGSSPG